MEIPSPKYVGIRKIDKEREPDLASLIQDRGAYAAVDSEIFDGRIAGQRPPVTFPDGQRIIPLDIKPSEANPNGKPAQASLVGGSIKLGGAMMDLGIYGVKEHFSSLAPSAEIPLQLGIVFFAGWKTVKMFQDGGGTLKTGIQATKFGTEIFKFASLSFPALEEHLPHAKVVSIGLVVLDGLYEILAALDADDEDPLDKV